MATIHIDDSKPFPCIPAESNNRRESFADLCKRQAAGLKLESDEMEQEYREQEELNALQKKRFERKRALLYNNLDLILRHRDEIIANPRYANIDVQYAIKGGGLYVGPLSTVRQFNFAGTLVSINLKLSTLLEVWDNEQFKVECECGGTAVIRSFTGSPLSGGSQATAVCPKCKKEIHVKNRNFGGYCGLMRIGLDRDIEKVVKSIIAKWTLAEVAYEKNAAEGKDAKWRKAGRELHDDGEPCNLETMLNELKLKEFQHASR
jgi:hypothetical protein